VIRGGAEMTDTESNRGGTSDHMTLCRCGASQNKPFCSGAHWNVRFDEDAGKS
jgi:CDGSH-type Zn-finger protein